MPISEFQVLAQSIQAIAVTVAACVGGAWAVYRFWSLRELTKAQVELEGLRRGLQERGTVNITLATKTIHNIVSNTHYILARAECTNIGNRSEGLNWSSGHVFCGRLREVKDGVPLFDEWSEATIVDNLGPLLGSILSPGGTDAFEFLVPLKSAGMYLITLSVDGSREETTEALNQQRKQGGPEGKASWSAMGWVSVDYDLRAVDAPQTPIPLPAH